MIFFPPELKIKSKMDKYLFFEMLWNTGAGMIGQFRGLAGDFLMGGVALKVFGITRYWWLLPIFGILYLLSVFILGYILIRKNVVIRRGALNNRIGNPQLMEILNEIKKVKKVND